jgi:hypothetical protein
MKRDPVWFIEGIIGLGGGYIKHPPPGISAEIKDDAHLRHPGEISGANSTREFS